MIKTDRAVIVEGKYDKIKLSNLIDGTIITTGGFSVFKDNEKKALIKRLAREKGLVVLTDSDNAGNMIRAYLKKICGNENIINVYIPSVPGKERRKQKGGAQGLLGVEGIDDTVLSAAFERSGVTAEICERRAARLTKQDLYVIGLSGGRESKYKRESLAAFLGLPRGLSSSAFLDAVNALYTGNEFIKQVELWRRETAKK